MLCSYLICHRTESKTRFISGFLYLVTDANEVFAKLISI